MKRPNAQYRLTEPERDFVFALIERVTGTCQQGEYRREVLATNVERRIRYVGARSLAAYLNYAANDPLEAELLVSALSIHTTSWFRELPHFHKLEQSVRQRLQERSDVAIKIMCAACSTGEEVYSIAFILEKLRREFLEFEYQIHGIDIDPISISQATRAVYGSFAFSLIPDEYKVFCDVGIGKRKGFFVPNAEIRRRCSFSVGDIRTISHGSSDSCEYIFCRNVLIYFKPEDVPEIVAEILSAIKLEGTLFLGHSESIDAARFGVRFIGDSSYTKRCLLSDISRNRGVGCRVLIVDDSLTARKAIERSLEKAGLVAVSVASAEEASEFLEKHSVDVITLDVAMPELDGPTWLNSKRLTGLGVPVVIVSESGSSQALSILRALENGAQDFIEKSAVSGEDFADRILEIARSFRPRNPHSPLGHSVNILGGGIKFERPDVILIGASTGGTEAVLKLLQAMPPDSPPILLVQHISAHFVRAFANRVAQNAGLKLGLCSEGVVLEDGHIYVGDHGRHLGISGRRGRLVITRSDGPAVNRHRPSVDFLFKSAAVIPNLKISAVLLTGMGADGAQGMRELHERGATTFAQNEESCVVFGMPREAIAIGAVDVVGSPADIRQKLQLQIGIVSEFGLAFKDPTQQL